MFDYMDRDVKDAVRKALMSGALSGSILGAGTRLLTGKGPATAVDLAKGALTGGAIAGGIGGGSTLLGSTVMGAPDENDSSGFTRRAGLGGALAGGVGGAILGALIAKGKIGLPSKTPAFMRQYLSNLKSQPNALLKGAGAGALAGGIPAGMYAADEGMQIDFINNELREQKKRRLLDAFDTIRGFDG